MNRPASALALPSLPLAHPRVQLAAAPARLERHTDAVAACDTGLKLVAGAAAGAAHRVSEHERLLLRRAGCFLALSQVTRPMRAGGER